VNPMRELDTAERIARDIDELDELENSLGRNKDARLKVIRLRRRRLAEAPSVRLSVAGKLLDLSIPTVRLWIERGLLEEVADSSPRRVTLQSVLEVRPVLRELRALGQDRNLLEAVLAQVEDERTLADPQLQRSLEEMHRGELIDVTPSRKRELAR
jgi:DNA-binding transcriptional MerR regulator